MQLVLALITLRLMTTFLDQTHIGSTFVIAAVSLGFTQIFTYPVAYYFNKKIGSVDLNFPIFREFLPAFIYFAVIALLGFAVLFFTKDVVGYAIYVQREAFFIYVGLYIFFNSTFRMLEIFFSSPAHLGAKSILQLSAQIFSLVGAIVSVKFFSATAVGWLSGLLAGQFLAIVLSSFWKTEVIQTPEVRSAEGSRIPYAHIGLLTFLGSFIWFISQGYRMIIEKYVDVQSLAFLGVAFSIVMILFCACDLFVTEKISWQDRWMQAVRLYLPLYFVILILVPASLRFLVSERLSAIGNYVILAATVQFMWQFSKLIFEGFLEKSKSAWLLLPYLVGTLSLCAGLIYLDQVNRLLVVKVMLLLVATSILILAIQLALVKFVLKENLGVKNLLRVGAFCLPLGAIFYFTRGAF